MVNHYLAMDAGGVTETISGIPTRSRPLAWMPCGSTAPSGSGLNTRYTVVDPPAVLATHLTEIIREHAHELLGRQEVQTLGRVR